MLALAGMIIGGGMVKAGEAGKVTIPKVIEVNAVGTGTATDGTGGYKPSHGVGTGSLKKKVTVSGNEFMYFASRTPSSSIDDSAVTITYKGPAVGEEEKSATAKCTVVELKIARWGTTVYGYNIKIHGEKYSYAIALVSGTAKPSGLGNVYITATPVRGKWRPPIITMFGSPVNYSAISSSLLLEGNPFGVGFNIETEYAGIKKYTFRICRRPFFSIF